MTMNTYPYECFREFVFRCPVLSTESPEPGFWRSTLFQESIYLASPDLHNALFPEATSPATIEDIEFKTRLSILRYRLRMSHRCTPFGLFAGCGIGAVGSYSGIVLDSAVSYRTNTRLDMNYLCALTQYLSELPELAPLLLYYPNSSLYRILHGYRYVEYKYVNSQRKHYLSEAESSSYLEELLRLAKRGALKANLIESLTSADIDEESASSFVQDLISSQILVSELDPTVTGDDLLQVIIFKLQQLKTAGNIIPLLESLRDKLGNIDRLAPGRSNVLYTEIEAQLKTLPITYDRKFLFQADLSVVPVTASLSPKVIESAKEGLRVLNKLTAASESPAMKTFRESFRNRYEDEEVPLAEVLDSDIGIGFFKTIPGKLDIHPLIDGIPQYLKPKKEKGLVSDVDLLLLKKYNEAENSRNIEIALTDSDLSGFEEKWTDLPLTISTLLEITCVDNTDSLPIILMQSAGGPSAANLLSRFCHSNEKLHQHVVNIVNKENILIQGNELLAEIIHLPESRAGNILFRPAFRKYEIPYLAQSSVTDEHRLPLSDLVVSVKGTEIILRSKKWNRRVLPRLTTAHNFSSNSLPIYHFLCQLQTHHQRSSLKFAWGDHLGGQPFLPRVRYDNIILSPARWNIGVEDIRNLPNRKNNDLLATISKFKEEKRIPDKVLLVAGDNKLLIDLTDPLSIQLLLHEVKGAPFILEEYLFQYEHSLIRGKNGTSYSNQVILSFYKTTHTQS